MNVETLHGVYTHLECQSNWSVETLRNIHMDTNMNKDTDCIISNMVTLGDIHMVTNMDMDMGCIISHTEMFIISIWIQIWIWIWGVLSVTWRHYLECTSMQSLNLHGTWKHSTLCNIHMDTNMDIDMECIIIHMECGEILQSIISIQNLFTHENQVL